MTKKVKKEDEIVDMEADEEGVFHPILPYRRPKVELHVHREVKVPPIYQFLDGFILGLEAVERFMRYTKRFMR